MKTVKGFVTLVSAFLIFGWIDASAQQEVPRPDHLRDKEEETVKIIINDFQYTGKDSLYANLGKITTEVLTYKFSNHPGAHLHYNIPYRERYLLNSRFYIQAQEDTRDITEYDYIIYGDFSVFKGEIFIKPVIYDVKSNQNYSLSTIVGETASLFRSFDDAGNQIYEKFLEISTTVDLSDIRLGIIYDDIGERTKKAWMAYYRDVIIQVNNSIHSSNDINILPWREMQEFYNDSELDLRSIADAFDIDILLHSRFKSIGKDIQLTTSILLKTSDQALRLPAYSSSYYQSIDFVDFISAEYQGIVDNILTEDKQWNTEPFKQYEDDNILLEMSTEYTKQEKFFFSSLLLRKVLERNIKSPKIHYDLGQNLIQLNRVEEAFIEFLKAKELDPDYAPAWAGEGFIYTQLGSYDLGLKSLEYAKEIDPEDNDTRLWLGMSYYRSKLYHEAVAELEQVLERALENFEIYKYLGLSYLEIATADGSESAEVYFDKAIDLFRSSHELGLDQSQSKYYLGNALTEKAIWAAKREECHKTIEYAEEAEQYHTFDYIYEYMIRCLLKDRRYPAARELTDKAVSLYILNAENIYYENALVIRESSISAGLYDDIACQEIIYYLDRHLYYKPNDFLATYLIGNSYLYLDDTDQGREYLERSVEIRPEAVEFQLDLLEVYILENEFNKCFELYQNIEKYAQKRDAFTPRHKALSLHLVITALKMVGESTKTEEKNLHFLLESGEVKITNWSFESYLNWLEQVETSQEIREYLSGMTELLMTHIE
jgi:tetratricopeptide (TPR) repeat protein